MTTYNTLFPQQLLVGATRRLVTSTSVVQADSGQTGRHGRFDYPLLEFTVDVGPDDAVTIEDLFFAINGPANAFLVESPLERDTVFINQPLVDSDGNPAHATGTAAGFQLAIWKEALDPDGMPVATRFKPILHYDPDTLRIYAGGSLLTPSPLSYHDSGLALFTIYAAMGLALTADFHARYAMYMADDHVETTLSAKGVEFVKQITLREAIGE